jgi:hypothetical protein
MESPTATNGKSVDVAEAPGTGLVGDGKGPAAGSIHSNRPEFETFGPNIASVPTAVVMCAA